MTTALIGHTGFVGGNLARQYRFDAHFNSGNYRDLAGREFDLLVCCGLSAAKWLANRDPEDDWARISALQDVLLRVRAMRFVLISTIDVYPVPVAVDESTVIDEGAGHPYGRHRLQFERFVVDHFPDVLVARLPALFGPGLKKNVLFDLLHANCLDAINPASRFQWYGVDRLWSDLERCRAQNLRFVNLVTAPVATADILARCFPGKPVGAQAPAASYDVRSRWATQLGGVGDYLLDAATVLGEIEKFAAASQRRGAA